MQMALKNNNFQINNKYLLLIIFKYALYETLNYYKLLN